MKDNRDGEEVEKKEGVGARYSALEEGFLGG